MVEANKDNWRDQVDITLSGWYRIQFSGFSKEGHPEQGCVDGEPCANVKPQDKEEFRVLVDNEELGRYSDQGLNRNKWFPFGDWSLSHPLGPNTYTIAVEHLHYGEKGIGSQSVDYKLSFCAVPVPAP